MTPGRKPSANRKRLSVAPSTMRFLGGQKAWGTTRFCRFCGACGCSGSAAQTYTAEYNKKSVLLLNASTQGRHVNHDD